MSQLSGFGDTPGGDDDMAKNLLSRTSFMLRMIVVAAFALTIVSCAGPGTEIPDNTLPPDSDGDGTADYADGCPEDPQKTNPGMCGCGVADTDTDSDGTPDCNDGCPYDANRTAPDICGCSVPDADSDGMIEGCTTR